MASRTVQRASPVRPICRIRSAPFFLLRASFASAKRRSIYVSQYRPWSSSANRMISNNSLNFLTGRIFSTSSHIFLSSAGWNASNRAASKISSSSADTFSSARHFAVYSAGVLFSLNLLTLFLNPYFDSPSAFTGRRSKIRRIASIPLTFLTFDTRTTCNVNPQHYRTLYQTSMINITVMPGRLPHKLIYSYYARKCGRMQEKTTITLKPQTRDRLAVLGGKGDSFDAIVNRLLDCMPRPAPSAGANAAVPVPPRRRVR